MNKQISIGMLGMGTVGGGVVKLLSKFDNVNLKKIAVKDINKKRNIKGLRQDVLTDNPESIVDDPEIKILVEVIGGINPAYDLIKRAIKNGKHIVTANKEIIAKHGWELFQLAKEHRIVILFEAAVAGGIPIILPLKLSLSGNKIQRVVGILNGTTNFILTKMQEKDAGFDVALKDAQKLGYAEADPSSDIHGHDAAYKIAILSSLAFNKRINIDKVYREGIEKICPVDIHYASEFGYKIKLIALGHDMENDGIDVRVHPMLVPKEHLLANINGILNGILVEGDAVGNVMFSGPGAGELPTASSVTGDILSIANELSVTEYPLPVMICRHDAEAKYFNINETKNKYYIRIMTHNTLGVIGELGLICGRYGINLYNIIQKGIFEDGTARIVLLTDTACEKDVQQAIKEISGNATISKVENVLRVLT